MSNDGSKPRPPRPAGSSADHSYSEPATERNGFVPLARRPTSPDTELPEPDAVPHLVLDHAELEWVALDQESLRFARLIDGVRSVRELAAICGCGIATARNVVAGLRERHVVRIG